MRAPSGPLSLDVALEALRRGHISFEVFARHTEPNWRGYAAYLARRWPPPVAVSREDLYQELLLAAWSGVRRYSPRRGASLRQFTVYYACDKAKKWLHKARLGGRLRNGEDAAPSRVERNFTSMGFEPGHVEEWLLRDYTRADELLEQRCDWEAAERLLDARAAEMPRRQRLAARILIGCGGDLGAAREQILRDPMAMLDMRIGEHQVTRVVTDAANRLIGGVSHEVQK